jgi:hypothetical protein
MTIDKSTMRGITFYEWNGSEKGKMESVKYG